MRGAFLLIFSKTTVHRHVSQYCTYIHLFLSPVQVFFERDTLAERASLPLVREIEIKRLQVSWQLACWSDMQHGVDHCYSAPPHLHRVKDMLQRKKTTIAFTYRARIVSELAFFCIIRSCICARTIIFCPIFCGKMVSFSQNFCVSFKRVSLQFMYF